MILYSIFNYTENAKLLSDEERFRLYVIAGEMDFTSRM